MPTPFLVAILAAAAIVAGLVHWWSRPPPEPPSLVVGTIERCVLDLVHVPSSVSFEREGAPFAVPGDPARYLAIEIRDQAAVIGWVGEPAAHPVDVSEFAKPVGRVAAFPDAADPQTFQVEGCQGWSRDGAIRVRLVVR